MMFALFSLAYFTLGSVLLNGTREYSAAKTYVVSVFFSLHFKCSHMPHSMFYLETLPNLSLLLHPITIYVDHFLLKKIISLLLIS